MPQDPFPSPERDGEEPARPVPPHAASGEPDSDPEVGAPGEPAAAGDGIGAEYPPEGPQQGLFVCLPAEELTLAGFAQNGRADTMPPGALLATLLEAIAGESGSGLAALSDDQLIGALSGARRLESRIAWMQMSALAELADRRPADGPCDSGQLGFSDFAADEVAAELHLTNQSAAEQIWYARDVAQALPRCFAALAAGRLHPVHLKIIQDETALLSPDDMAQADELLAGIAGSLTFGRLRSKAHLLVRKLDPDAARKRKEAAKQDAHVCRFREDSGNAGMMARELPPDEVLAGWQHVEQRALDLRAAGMPGTLRELRVRAYLDLLQERDSRLVPANPGPDEAGRTAGGDRCTGPDGLKDQADLAAGPDCDPAGPEDQADRPAGPGSDGRPADPGGSNSGGSGPQPRGPGGSGGPGSGPRHGGPGGTDSDGHARQARQDGPSVAALVNILIPFETLLGRSEAPGEAAGYGLLDAEDARDLVAAAARHPHTRWCVTALHPDGTAAAHGCATGRHPPPGPISGGHAPGPGPDPPADPSPGTSSCTATGGHSPGLGPDPPSGTATDGHSPGVGPDPPPGTTSTKTTSGAPGPDPPSGTRLKDYLASLRIRMIPVARGHCDHTRAETGYRPSRALQHRVKVRNTRCTAPGCGRAADRCDLDHTLAWDQGGLTCECDLAPLCRHHHRCKQSQGWKLEQQSPGVLRWNTPAGRSYTTTPTTYAA